MSLINDALKRARQNRPERPAARQPDPTLSPAEHGRARSLNAPAAALVVSLMAAIAGGWFFWKWAQPNRQVEARERSGAVDEANRPGARAPRSRESGGPAGANGTVQGGQDTNDFRAILSTNGHVGRVDGPLSPSEGERGLEREVLGSGSPGVSGRDEELNEETHVPRTVALAEGDGPLPTNGPVARMDGPLSPSEGERGPVAFPDLKLQGIFYRLQKPSALINNRTVYVGDEIQGARVISVQRYSVKLQLGNQVKELSLR